MAQESIKVLLAVKDQYLRETIKLLLNEQLGLWDIEMTDSGPGVVEKIKNSSGKSSGMSALLGGLTASSAAPSPGACVFNLVVMDWNLDEGEEFASLKEIRRRYDRKNLPVLLITKERNEQEIRTGVMAGANNFLFIPITADLLNSKFKDVLGKKHDFKAQAALSIFQKQEGGPKKDEKKKKEQKPQILTGGASYHSKKEVSEEEARFAVSRFLSPDEKINGHFHRMVDVVGGGRNCLWAREGTSEDGGTVVELEYVTSSGSSSGMHADTISKSQFMETFYICTEENCSIIRTKSQKDFSANELSPSRTSGAPGQAQGKKLPLHVHETMEDGKRSSACYIAEKKNEQAKIIMSLNYISSSERSLGHAKNVDMEQFQKRFMECTPQNCTILKKKEEQKQLEESTKKDRLTEKAEAKGEIKSSPTTAMEEKMAYNAVNPINAHYQGGVKSGATNCLWAKEKSREGMGIIELEYITPKGTSSGIKAKTLSKVKFLSDFTLCTTDNCQILKSLALKSAPEKGADEKKGIPSPKAEESVSEATGSFLKEKTSNVDGHYQEAVDKTKDIKKCVWAKEIIRDGKKIIETFILSVKGKSTGIHDCYVSIEEFNNRFTLCSRDNCAIMKRL
jgi:DNA-binding response OmpR family regulator